MPKPAKSKYNGVTLQSRRWVAVVTELGQTRTIASFDTAPKLEGELLAAQAYDKYVRAYLPELMHTLNFPE